MMDYSESVLLLLLPGGLKLWQKICANFSFLKV